MLITFGALYCLKERNPLLAFSFISVKRMSTIFGWRGHDVSLSTISNVSMQTVIVYANVQANIQSNQVS